MRMGTRVSLSGMTSMSQACGSLEQSTNSYFGKCACRAAIMWRSAILPLLLLTPDASFWARTPIVSAKGASPSTLAARPVMCRLAATTLAAMSCMLADMPPVGVIVCLGTLLHQARDVVLQGAGQLNANGVCQVLLHAGKARADGVQGQLLRALQLRLEGLVMGNVEAYKLRRVNRVGAKVRQNIRLIHYESIHCDGLNSHGATPKP